MEIEKYSPIWLLEKINASKTDADKLMHIIEYRKKLVESTEKQFAIHSVSQQRELLDSLADEFNDSTHTYVGQTLIEKILKEFNCG